MRRFALLFGPFTLLTAAIFACESDQNGGGGPSLSLDGSPGTFDGSSPFDGTTPDPDSAPDVQGPPQVTVSVTGASGPRAGVRVVFHDASGAVLETKLTGADGKASSTGPLPAMASALLATGSMRNIVTWTGLENGDTLVVRDVETSDYIGSYNVTLPGLFADAGATEYDLNAGSCYGFTTTGTGSIDLTRGCVGSKSSVLATAKGANGNIVGHSFKKGNDVPTDGGAIAVATGAWAGSSSIAFSATGLPASTGADAELLEIADGYGYSSGYQSLDVAGATFPSAVGFADALQATLHLYPGDYHQHQVITKRVAPAATIAIDATTALPPITAATISGTDARRPILSWTSTSTAGADGGLVHVRYFGPEDANYRWTFVVPPGSSSVTAPAMPVEAESFLPENGDAGPTAFASPPEVAFVEADVLPSYAAFRQQQGALVSLDMNFGGFSLPAMPTNGVYRATVYQEGD